MLGKEKTAGKTSAKVPISIFRYPNHLFLLDQENPTLNVACRKDPNPFGKTPRQKSLTSIGGRRPRGKNSVPIHSSSSSTADSDAWRWVEWPRSKALPSSMRHEGPPPPQPTSQPNTHPNTQPDPQQLERRQPTGCRRKCKTYIPKNCATNQLA